MALDTIKLNVGVDGDDLGADNIGGVQYEVVKQAFGIEGDLNLVSSAVPLPVTDNAAEVSLASIDAKLTNPLPVSGTVAVSSLPSGLAVSALQQTDALTNTQLRATPVPVSGTVTVDTSLLATAANQVTEIASLSVLDDWDESDRAKVNLIVGQAGIAAGTGTDGATVPRVTLATNVGLPAGSSIIGKVGIDQTTPGTTNNVNVGTRVASTPTKTALGTLISLQTCASGAVVVGSPLNVATKFGMFIGIHIGRTATTALTNPAKVRIEATMATSGTLYWFPIAEFLSSTIASTTTATLTTGTSAGTATLPMTATAAILIGDLVYIQEAGGQTNSEFGRVITVNANTSVILEEVTTYAHTITTTKVWSKADYFPCAIDVSRYMQVRAVVDCAYSLSGQTIVAEVVYSTLDSIV